MAAKKPLPDESACKNAENGEKAAPDTGIGIKAVNERIIARDIGGLVADWCGNRAVVLYGDGSRIEWVN